MGKTTSKLWDVDPFGKYKPEDYRQEIKVIQDQSASISPNRKHRIVVCACSKEGKSSSINAILASLEGKSAHAANVGGLDQHVTKECIEYKMLIGDEKDTSYQICDTPGLKDGITEDEGKVQAEAIIAVINGKFQSGDEIDYKNLTLAALEVMAKKTDCAVCVIFVIDVRKVKHGVIDHSMAFKSMMSILEFVQGKDIKVACLLTHCDELDEAVKQNTRNICQSRLVEDARQMLEKKFRGFPLNRIFPIANCTDKLTITDDMMVQNLFAMKYIMTDILANLRKRVVPVK